MLARTRQLNCVPCPLVRKKYFETGSHGISQASFELTVQSWWTKCVMLLPQPSELGIAGLHHHFQLVVRFRRGISVEENQHREQELELTE